MKPGYLFLTLILLLLTGAVSAQDTVAVILDFEEDSASWKTSDTVSPWEHTNDKAASGNRSIAFRIGEEYGAYTPAALKSINTGYTILKVRTAKFSGQTLIIGSSYEGTVVCFGYDGVKRWENKLSGYMNHDISCADLNGDEIDEILVASADGTLYCLNSNGGILWEFKPNICPLYSVCTIEKDNVPYVVCGGFDKSFYYLSATGKQLKEIKSSTYSEEKPWSRYPAVLPPDYTHTTNFIRPFKRADGETVLCVNGTNNQMNVDGTFYLFEPFADLPYRKDEVETERVVGDFRIYDTNDDEDLEIIVGTSGHKNEAGFSVYDQYTGLFKIYPVEGIRETGYLITQTEKIPTPDGQRILVLAGNNIMLYEPGDTLIESGRMEGTYAYNDMWKDDQDRIILASIQSGGSCIHILDTQNPQWESAFVNIEPSGKIRKILNNTQIARNNLKSFTAPEWERDPKVVTFMTDNHTSGAAADIANEIKTNYSSPIFLNSNFMREVQSPESWNRDTISNEKYRDKRDKRKSYVLSQQEVLDIMQSFYVTGKGMSTWGGHGNDPFFYSPETIRMIIDLDPGKRTVLVYPEVGDESDDFYYVMDHLFYPTMEHIRDNNRDAYMFMRYKNIYWQSIIYKPFWNRVMEGEFADIVVPALEETSDKTMELSISGRLGLWSSGVVNQWGTRCVPDNACFDRSRQIGYQRLPNHFLRTYIYHISLGATFINNFSVDQQYLSFLWELIAKGALYVPERSEILSFSPVHLGMKDPDHDYINDGGNVKWTTFFEEGYEEENPFVFSRMNGSWLGAPLTEYDFSNYAAGVADRRLNFLPPYKNGLVMITPPQEGAFANDEAQRGKLVDKLHPLYKDIMQEFITDGRNYYSTDGTETYEADEYYTRVQSQIEESAKELPLTVEGNVAWVVAQSAPTHLRLTIIDGGYLNPDDRKATVSFHAVTPINMTDLLDGTNFDLSNPSSIELDIPCGLFRFIDIELDSEL